ncbi:T9SS type A sorting domain-containing protein [Flavobacterium sp. LAR06]
MKQSYYFLIISFSTIICMGQTKNLPTHRLNKSNLNELLVKKQVDFTFITGADSDKEETLINFNPIILDYSKASSLRIKQKIEELSNATYFTVYVSDKVLPEQELWSVKAANSTVDLTNKVVVNGKETIPYEGGKLDAPTLNSYTKTFDARNKVNNATTFMEFGNFSGKEKKASKGILAELVIYNKVLRNKDKQAVETGLALKYGITLTNSKDYLSSDKKIIFDVEDAPAFVNRIAGIGKDEALELNQKQSHSTQTEGIVTIGVDEIATSNQENKGIIEDKNFLVWGDNNAPLTAGIPTENSSLPLLQRKWLIKATGDQARALSTIVQFDANAIFSDLNLDLKRYLLVIDKSGKGTFLPENLQYFPASKMDGNALTFSDVLWDTDQSGTDVFTFALSEKLEVALAEEVSEVCVFGENGILDFNVSGGIAPYTFELLKDSNVLTSWESKDGTFPDNKISKLGTANYTLQVTDQVESKKNVSYLLTNPELVAIDLGANKRFAIEQSEMVLEPIITSNNQNLKYHWTSDKGFSSDVMNATITEPATYTLTVTTEKGCTVSASVTVDSNYATSFVLYPNESSDGNYNLSVVLAEPQDFTIAVYDMSGRMISTSKANNKTNHIIRGKRIGSSGVYEVVIFNENFKIAKKLIVK